MNMKSFVTDGGILIRSKLCSLLKSFINLWLKYIISSIICI